MPRALIIIQTLDRAIYPLPTASQQQRVTTLWHTLAFFTADTAGATDEQIPAVRDQIVTQSPNGNYILQQDMLVRAAYFRDAGATGARILTPDYRRISIPHIHPVQRAAGVTSLPNIQRYQPATIRIPKIDEVVFQGSNNGAGGIAAVGALWLSPPGDNVNIPAGDVYKLHGTATSTGVAGEWELCPLILDENLPTGVYTVIGLDATAVGAAGSAELLRLAWTGGNQPGGGQLWRPGVLVQPSFANQNWPYWQSGGWGTLGSFSSTAQPSVEVLSVPGTALTYDVYLDVIKSG